MGSRILRSTSTKATRNTTVRISGTIVRAVPQPHIGDCVRGTNKAIRAAPTSPAPAQSGRAPTRGDALRSWASAPSNFHPPATVAMAMGTLMK